MKGILLVFFGVLLFVMLTGTHSVKGEELSTDEPPAIFIEDKVTVNVVFVGLTPDSSDIQSIQENVTNYYMPGIMMGGVPELYGGWVIGVNYTIDLRMITAPEQFQIDITNYYNDSMYSDSTVKDYTNMSSYYLDDYWDLIYGAANYSDYPVWNIDARKAEDWLKQNAESYAGLDGIFGNYTLFIMFLAYAETPYYYSVNGTDLDTGKTFSAKNLNGYGGNYNFAFIDFYAWPPNFGDGYGGNGQTMADFDESSPYWYDQATGGSTITASVSRCINEAIEFLFLHSYLYRPVYEIEYELDVIAFDCTSNDSFYDVAQQYINVSAIEDALKRLVPYTNWTFDIRKANIEDYPELSSIINASEIKNGAVIIDSNLLKPACNQLVIRPGGFVTVPCFIFIFDEKGWVDRENTMGGAQSVDGKNPWGIIMASGMSRMDDYGLSNTIIHETGHSLGLMHPHHNYAINEFGLAYNEDGFPTKNKWFWDFSSTIMGYYEKMCNNEFSTFDRDVIDRGLCLNLLNSTIWKWHDINSTLVGKGYTWDMVPDEIKTYLECLDENYTNSINEFRNKTYFVETMGVPDSWSYAFLAFLWANETYKIVQNLSDQHRLPGTPSITTAPYTDADGSYRVNWTTAAYAAGYIIEENGVEVHNGTAPNYDFTGKSDGTYSYTVKSWNSNGTSNWSQTLTITVFGPKTPAAPTITTTPYTDTDGSYSINWTTSDYVTNYIIYESGVQIYNGTNTTLSYAFMNKSDGTYTYTVTAWNINGTSANSTSIAIIVDITKLPSTPSITTVAYTDTDGNYTLNWTSSTYATSYILYENGIEVYNGTATQVLVQGRSDGTYLYNVRAWNSNGTSNWSQTLTITVFGPKTPAAPTITTTPYTDTDGSYSINWTASNYVTNYIIYENGVQIFNGTNTTLSYSFTNKLDGTYTYIVAAWNINGTSVNSTSVAIIVDSAKIPSAPSITTNAYTDTDGSYNINWTASNYVTNYIIYENGVQIYNGTNTTLSYAFTNKPDGTYTYAVKAWNTNGTSANSTSVAIIVDIAKLPSAPSITTVAYTDTDSNYSINWTASDYAVNYTLYENGTAVYNGATPTFALSAKADGTYTYAVVAWNINGTSAASASVAIAVFNPKIPGIPAITTIAYTDTGGNYSINWTSSNYAANYVLYENGTVAYNGTALTYAATNKLNGTYAYNVQARNINGTSANSTQVSVTVNIPGATPSQPNMPAVPSITTVAYTDTGDNYNINWTAANYATNYIIYENGVQIFNGTNTTYTYAFTGKSNGTYAYKVAAWNINGTSANSTDVAVTVSIPAFANMPSAPSITTVSYTDTDGNYSINWTTSTYAANYILYENDTVAYNGTALTCPFTNKPNGTYIYKVCAQNANGTSANSSAATIIVSISTPTTAQPNLPSASSITTVGYTDADGNYTLNWTSSTYTSNYILEENGAEIYNGTALTYSVSGRQDGTYAYTVRAWNANGTSYRSPSVTITVAKQTTTTTGDGSKNTSGFVPGFEFVTALGAVCLAVVLMKRRKLL